MGQPSYCQIEMNALWTKLRQQQNELLHLNEAIMDAKMRNNAIYAAMNNAANNANKGA